MIDVALGRKRVLLLLLLLLLLLFEINNNNNNNVFNYIKRLSRVDCLVFEYKIHAN